MKRFMSPLLALVFSVLIASCAGPKDKNMYIQITPDQAKEVMDSGGDFVILDVRTDAEYNEGHIPGAVLIPDYEISGRAESVLTDKSRTVLVYCRSGRRSKIAASLLAGMGYTDVREFGGIIDWQYEVTQDNPKQQD